ncbi:MAG: type II secretion system protein [Armatimonadota bacterium]
MKRSGFTLIELLVVIAIIAILAALLFPVFGKVKDNAKAASCQSNMKQITLAVLAYADDNGNRLPGLNLFTIAEGTGGSLSDTNSDPSKGSLFRYLGKSREVVKCPADARWRLYSYAGKYWYSYTVNSYTTWIGHRPDGVYIGGFTIEDRIKCNTSGPPLSWFPRPTRVIYLVEEKTQDFANQQGQFINDALFHGIDVTSDRHMGYSNVSFLDSHCGRVPGGLTQTDGKYPDGRHIFHP